MGAEIRMVHLSIIFLHDKTLHFRVEFLKRWLKSSSYKIIYLWYFLINISASDNRLTN